MKWNYPEILAKRLIYGTFMSPTTVATVDQLLLSLFNWRHWEMIEQNDSELCCNGRPYYEGFMYGCMDAGNTEEICDNFTD